MTDGSVGGRANQLGSVADAVPLGSANKLCDAIERVRDQLAEITGPEAEIIGHTQQTLTAATEVVRSLAALRNKIQQVGQHHQGGGSRPPTVRTKDRKPAPKTVADEEGTIRSFPSFSAAKRALGPKPGYELHHIVEQSQSKETRSGFSAERINTTDNLIWLPVPVHRRITARYARKLRESDLTLRNAMNGLSWDEQHSRGLRAVRRALREAQEDDR